MSIENWICPECGRKFESLKKAGPRCYRCGTPRTSARWLGEEPVDVSWFNADLILSSTFYGVVIHLVIGAALYFLTDIDTNIVHLRDYDGSMIFWMMWVLHWFAGMTLLGLIRKEWDRWLVIFGGITICLIWFIGAVLIDTAAAQENNDTGAFFKWWFLTAVVSALLSYRFHFWRQDISMRKLRIQDWEITKEFAAELRAKDITCSYIYKSLYYPTKALEKCKRPAMFVYRKGEYRCGIHIENRPRFEDFPDDFDEVIRTRLDQKSKGL